MRTFDFSPLYRTTVGFDRLFDMLDQTSGVETAPHAPPYNVEKLGDDHYRIIMALAGFRPDDVEVVQQESTLIITGQKRPSDENTQILHRGIATRSFGQTFDLADHMKVTAAHLENGLLTIELVREIPEEMKPRRIEIATSDGPKTITQEKAA